MITKIALMIYRLSYTDTIYGCVLFSLVLVWLRRRYGQRIQPLLWALLLTWSLSAIYLTIGSRDTAAIYRLNLIPFHSYREMVETGKREILRSNFMNVVLFYPAGLLFAMVLPKRWSIARRAVAAAAVFGLFSLAIELAQYCCLLGQAEIDDVIHNTLGALLGCLAISLENM